MRVECKPKVKVLPASMLFFKMKLSLWRPTGLDAVVGWGVRLHCGEEVADGEEGERCGVERKKTGGEVAMHVCRGWHDAPMLDWPRRRS